MARAPLFPLVELLAKLLDSLPERFFHLKPLDLAEAEDPCLKSWRQIREVVE